MRRQPTQIQSAASAVPLRSCRAPSRAPRPDLFTVDGDGSAQHRGKRKNRHVLFFFFFFAIVDIADITLMMLTRPFGFR